MRKIKKAAAVAISTMICMGTLFGNIYAAESKWDIDNTLEISECRQGDSILLSVTLKGSSTSKSEKIASLGGTLEYDTSLFTVEKADILPTEKEKVKDCSFDISTGKFAVQYTSDVTVKNESMLLQIMLHVAEDASTGKTTVCVTNMDWSSSDSKNKQEMEHHVPAYITIRESEEKAVGDINGDGKVDLEDAKLAMQYYNGTQSLDSTQQNYADVNGDGKVNLTDVKLIMQYYNGEIDELIVSKL